MTCFDKIDISIFFKLGDVRKCIEIKRDEDEIEKRIDALELMYTNAEDISIECLYGNYIKFLPNILFFLICLYF